MASPTAIPIDTPSAIQVPISPVAAPIAVPKAAPNPEPNAMPIAMKFASCLSGMLSSIRLQVPGSVCSSLEANRAGRRGQAARSVQASSFRAMVAPHSGYQAQGDGRINVACIVITLRAL